MWLTAAAHRNLVSVEDVADRAPLDTESGGQFVHGCSRLTAGDQLSESVGVESMCALWFGPFDGYRGRYCDVGKFLDQDFQGFRLRFWASTCISGL